MFQFFQHLITCFWGDEGSHFLFFLNFYFAIKYVKYWSFFGFMSWFFFFGKIFFFLPLRLIIGNVEIKVCVWCKIICNRQKFIILLFIDTLNQRLVLNHCHFILLFILLFFYQYFYLFLLNYQVCNSKYLK